MAPPKPKRQSPPDELERIAEDLEAADLDLHGLPIPIDARGTAHRIRQIAGRLRKQGTAEPPSAEEDDGLADLMGE